MCASIRLRKRYRCLPNLSTYHIWEAPHVASTFHTSHTLFFKAETGKAFTTFLAGLALTITTLPKTSLFPAFVAGFILVLILHTPGMVKIPVLFTSCVAISARLLMIFPHSLFLISVLAQSASAMAPFVITFALVAFMGAIGEGN